MGRGWGTGVEGRTLSPPSLLSQFLPPAIFISWAGHVGRTGGVLRLGWGSGPGLIPLLDPFQTLHHSPLACQLHRFHVHGQFSPFLSPYPPPPPRRPPPHPHPISMSPSEAVISLSPPPLLVSTPVSLSVSLSV